VQVPAPGESPDESAALRKELLSDVRELRRLLDGYMSQLASLSGADAEGAMKKALEAVDQLDAALTLEKVGARDICGGIYGCGSWFVVLRNLCGDFAGERGVVLFVLKGSSSWCACHLSIKQQVQQRDSHRQWYEHAVLHVPVTTHPHRMLMRS
jgi:hypothetical protein